MATRQGIQRLEDKIERKEKKTSERLESLEEACIQPHARSN